jgi:hypothetical protein
VGYEQGGARLVRRKSGVGEDDTAPVPVQVPAADPKRSRPQVRLNTTGFSLWSEEIYRM